MSLETVGGMCMYTHQANHKEENALASSGHQKITWAAEHMPIMNQLLKEYTNLQPLSGFIIVTSVHMEAKTAFLVQTLARLGATVYATGCNPLSTQDDVATALNETPHVTVYAKHNCSDDEYWSFLRRALEHHPHIIIDDGGDLTQLLHEEDTNYRVRLLGGCEETTTGVHRLKALSEKNELLFPMYDVNDANCKHLFDNHYGTGQSVVDGIIRTTNLIVAGKTVVIAGYGDCGSGIAMRMHGLGANVIITEVDPIKALRAHMDGFHVMTMNQAAGLGDIFITATGCADVITNRHFFAMKDGAILANAGHFDVEINVKELRQSDIYHGTDETWSREVRKNIEAYQLSNGKTLYLLAGGRLVNLAAADGHPAEIMDMSFSIQLLCVIDIANNFDISLTGFRTPCSGLYSIPEYIDQKVAKLALQAQGIKTDKLTKAQIAYLKNGF